MKYVSYKYDPHDDHVYYAECRDEEIKPGDMAVVNSMSRYGMCIVQIEEIGIVDPNRPIGMLNSQGEPYRCYGVFDRSKWDEAVEREEMIARNLSQ